jgi:hypothetical protein
MIRLLPATPCSLCAGLSAQRESVVVVDTEPDGLAPLPRVAAARLTSFHLGKDSFCSSAQNLCRHDRALCTG